MEAVWDASVNFLGALEVVLGHAEAFRAPPLHEKMHTPVCTLLLSFGPPCGRKFPRSSCSHSWGVPARLNPKPEIVASIFFSIIPI